MNNSFKLISALFEKRLFCIFILAVSAFAVSINILANGFVWDDEMLILKNKWITDIRYVPDILISSEWAFTEEVESHSNFYRPFFHIYCMAGYFLSGLESWGYHLLNLIFHAANTVMVFLVLSLILESFEKRLGNAGTKAQSTISSEDSRLFSHVRFIAFGAALLFATHPVHVEPVAWTSASAQELTFTFFSLLSFYLYIYGGKGNGLFRMESQQSKISNVMQGKYALYFLALISFFFATLCKETALTLPLLFFLYDYCKGKSFNLIASFRYFPLLIVIIIYLTLRGHALGSAVPTPVQHTYLTDYQFVINIFPLFVTYLWKLIFPINLNAFYIFNPVYSLFEPKAIVSLLIVCFLTVLTLWLRRVNKVIFFSLLWIVIPLLPALYIPVVGRNVFAERYAYFSSVGFVLLLTYSVSMVVLWVGRRGEHVTEEKKRILNSRNRGQVNLAFFLAIIVVLYSIGTIKGNAVWRSDESLWRVTALKPPGNYYAYNFLGDTLSKENRFKEALDAYTKSLELGYLTMHADYNILGSAHYNRGVIYGTMGLTGQALEEYDKAIKHKPAFFNAYYNSGIIYSERDLVDKAIDRYLKALPIAKRLNDQILIHVNLGNAYARKGLTKEAIVAYETVLKIDPTNNMAAHNLSILRRKE